MVISKSVVLVLALVGLALPTVGGGAMLQPAAAQEEEFSLEEILDLAFDLADIDLDLIEDGGPGGNLIDSPNDDGGGDGGGNGDGTQEEANVQQQDSTQERTQGETNVNQNIQTKVQRQSEQIVTDDGGTIG
jgi:hypothetical protein